MNGSASLAPRDRHHAAPADHRLRLAREVGAAVGSGQEGRWIVEEAEGDEGRARELAARRARGEPLQHVLGHWSFRTLDVLTDRRALVPRPETEVVAEIALAELRRRHPAGPLLAADLGTGSGVIACSLARELGPGTRVFATDRSAAALSLARQNVTRTLRQSTAQVTLCEGSWFEALPGELAGRFDLLVSNPPYLASQEWHRLPPVVREHDPYEALVAGESGLEAIGEIVAGAPPWLSPDGSLVVEIAPHQADAARALCEAAGFGHHEVRPDLAGRERVLVARP